MAAPNSDRSGWALSYVHVAWRREVAPLLRRASKTEDMDERVRLSRQALRILTEMRKALREAVRLAADPEAD